MALAKRSYGEAFGELSSIKQTSPKAKVRGLLTGVCSAMKGDGCQFWDGEIVDNSSSMRIYGYDPASRRRLFDFQQRGESVVLTECAVKKARFGDNLEIYVSDSTSVETSEMKFDSSLSQVASAELKDLYKLRVNKLFTITVKVLYHCVCHGIAFAHFQRSHLLLPHRQLSTTSTVSNL